MQLILRGSDGAAARALAHRESLPTGAYVALQLQVAGTKPLWIYPYHRTASGQLKPLSGEPTAIAVGVVYELPAAGLWYQLVGEDTKDTFYALASQTPLGERLADELTRLPDEREPPPRSNSSNRLPGPSYQRELDERGFAALAISVLRDRTPGS